MRFGFDFLPEDVSGGDTQPTVVERTYVDKVTASDGVTYDIQDTVALERANGYFIDYTVGTNNTLTAVNSDANKQAAIKILEVINTGVRPIVYARITKSLDHYTVPCVVDVGRGSTHTSFDLTFILSTGYDTDVLKNDTYDYEDHISVSGSTVTHTIHMTDLRATQVISNSDGNGHLTYWRLPRMYKRYEYFNAAYYHGPMDEGNDYYQSVPFVAALCTDYEPHEGSVIQPGFDDFTNIANAYQELPPMLYLHFAKRTDAGGIGTGDAYWVPISKIISERSEAGLIGGTIVGFTGTFIDKKGFKWDVKYDSATDTGKITYHDELPTIPTGVTLADFVNTLPFGVHHYYYPSTNQATDAPVSSNALVVISKFTAVMAHMEFTPITSSSVSTYKRSRTTGTWRNWVKYDGTSVT